MKQLLWNNPTFESFTLQSNKVSNVELSPLVKSTIFDDGKINILLIAFFDVCQSLYLFGILMYLITEKSRYWRITAISVNDRSLCVLDILGDKMQICITVFSVYYAL